MYKSCIAVCYSFAILLLALFALIVSDSGFTPASNSGAFLLQDLTTIRIWIVIAGALAFAWKVNKKEPRGLTVTVLTVLAWIMFLEDFMVLDMLKYSFNMQEDSVLVENAVQAVLSKGLRTADISDGADKIVSTQDMGKAVIEELNNLSGS